MQQCWDQDETKRPTFEEILSILENFMKVSQINLESHSRNSPPINHDILSKTNYAEGEIS